MPASVKQRRYHAPALDKGLDILECLAEARLPLSQLELAQVLNRTPSELYRMLMCLEERGYVAREAESGKFRLTLRLYELGHKQNALSLLRKSARMPMEALADETGQGCHLSIPYDNNLLVLMERMPARRICLAVGEGTVFPLVETSSGKLLISRLTDEKLHELLDDDPHFKSLSNQKRSKFLLSIAEIRADNCLVMPSQLTEGVTDIAVPVGVAGTDTAAVLAISYFSSQRKSLASAYPELVLKYAKQINQNLGITT